MKYLKINEKPGWNITATNTAKMKALRFIFRSQIEFDQWTSLIENYILLVLMGETNATFFGIERKKNQCLLWLNNRKMKKKNSKKCAFPVPLFKVKQKKWGKIDF